MTWRPLPGSRRAGSEGEPRLVRESLEPFAQRVGAPKVEAVGAVFAGWEAAVGASVAAHCRAVSLVDGVLQVEVDQPGWATQLRYLAPDVIRRLEETVGEDVVARIEVRVRRF
jgi:predicted nucleic acid-binding Zn ribbon protein